MITDHSLWNDKCDYYELSKVTDFNPDGYNLVVLQLNIRSMLTNISESRQLISTLDNKGTQVDLILSCETYLNRKTIKLVTIPGYEMITNCQETSKGGGTAILIRSNIPYKLRPDLVDFIKKDSEMSYIEITTKSGKSIVVGSLYRLPNSSDSALIDHIENIITKVKLEKNHKQLILGMDHNFDLLKCNQHRPTKRFLDKMMDLNMLPAITRPTRITSNTATVIDNVFISDQLQRNFDSGLIVDDISDHLPSIVLIKQTHITDKSSIEFDSRILTDDKISRIKAELMHVDWNGTLNNEDCSVNFENFCIKLNMIMDSIAPIKHVRISGKCHFVEPWMTTGLETASQNNKKLYLETLIKGCSISNMEKYKTSRSLLNRLKRSTMKNYYATKCTEYRDNTRKLWQVINQTIGKTKHSGSIIPFISIEGIKSYDAKRISNEFGKFYANLGRNLASQISPGMRTVDDYLANIP